jgi:hypothetical protein
MIKNKLKNIELIVFDLDGSLLNNKGMISNESKAIINELKALGVQFTFASGRLHSAVKKYASELEISLPIISLDGTYIKNYSSDVILFESFVKEKYVNRALDYADRLLIKIALCHADAIYYTESNIVISELMSRYGAIYKQVDDYRNYTSETLEIVLVGDMKDSMMNVRERMSFPYTWGCNTSFYKSQTHEGLFYLEIRKKGATKGKALLKLLNYLNLKPEHTAVMGDWYNDISLFQTSAVKIAPFNAVPEIKSLADFVTRRTNNEDAAAEFLEMVLKSKKI